jgi:hypothetical protein
MPPLANRRAQGSDWRAGLLFFLPLPLAWAGWQEIRAGDAAGMIAEWGALAALLLGAWLLRDGLRAEEAYRARRVARPPAIPRKLFAAVLAGTGVLLATGFGRGLGLIPGLAFGGAALLLHLFVFGADPMRRKGMEGIDPFEAERVATAVAAGEKLLAQTQDAAARIGDRGLEARVRQLCESARQVFRAVEEDPRDLSRARRFMSVYLMGARDATARFADLWSRSRDAGARSAYEALLADLEKSFAAQRETLLVEDRAGLDIEIQVLQERLRNEGLIPTGGHDNG